MKLPDDIDIHVSLGKGGSIREVNVVVSDAIPEHEVWMMLGVPPCMIGENDSSRCAARAERAQFLKIRNLK